MNNPFVGKAELLDDLLRLLESKGVNAPMLDAWATARGMLVDAKEQAREFAKDGHENAAHSVWDEYESQREAALDESQSVAEYLFDDVEQALKVAYTHEQLHRNLIEENPHG